MKKTLLLAAFLSAALSLPAFAFDNTNSSGAARSTTSTTSRAAAPAAGGIIDINHADAKTLANLRGIGPARANQIIAGRPYNGKDDLVNRKIIPANVYSGISSQIIAKQEVGAMAKTAWKRILTNRNFPVRGDYECIEQDPDGDFYWRAVQAPPPADERVEGKLYATQCCFPVDLDFVKAKFAELGRTFDPARL